jgi:hypothetical protein
MDCMEQKIQLPCLCGWIGPPQKDFSLCDLLIEAAEGLLQSNCRFETPTSRFDAAKGVTVGTTFLRPTRRGSLGPRAPRALSQAHQLRVNQR